MAANHYMYMILIMFISGLLSSMYIWAYQLSDIQLSINDFYMIFLMTGWMCFFMTLLNRDYLFTFISLTIIIIILIGIRRQLFVSKWQYFRGMIPHHSMAVLMSQRLLANDKSLKPTEKTFVENIIKTQKEEIEWMKSQ